MENERVIAYLVFESVTSEMERSIKRLWIVVLVLIFLLVGTNLAWLIFESQYEDYIEQTIEATQDGSGTNIVGGGNVNYGAEGNDNNN